jgi:hypothetical protein
MCPKMHVSKNACVEECMCKKMQVSKNERVAQPPSAVQISHANRMANKTRNNPSMISADNKKIFQGRERMWGT